MSSIATEKRLGLSFCERLELSFTHGRGTWVWDEAGKAYLDFTSGCGVTCLGHSHPAVTRALSEQGRRLMQSPNAGFTYSPARAALLDTLRPHLPPGLVKTWFCNSGAEANDAALKLARKITGRAKVIAARQGFHGRTWNAMAVTRGGDWCGRHLPSLGPSAFVPHGDSAALAAALDEDTAAVIVEPVQGGGGVRVPPAAWLAQVRALCRRHGAVLIVDEIQTGFCRTGRFFALEHSPEAVTPCILTMGKGIAGGFPFAAFSVSASVAARLGRDDHGGTYCGNPLGCAVSQAVIQYLAQHRVAERARSAGAFLLAGLAQLQAAFPGLVREVRGLGLLCALELREPAQSQVLTRRCAELGLLVVPTRGGVLRLLPDLLVSREDLAAGLDLLREALAGLQRPAKAARSARSPTPENGPPPPASAR